MNSDPTLNNGEQNPEAAKWENLYKELEKKANENFLDSQEFIENKAKRSLEYREESAERNLKDATKKHDEELKEIERLKAELERTSNRSEEDYNKEHYEDFAGETNKNSKTGKERTYNDFDKYSGESGEERKRRHDLTVLTEHVPKLPAEDASAYSERIGKLHEDFPRKDGESLEEYRDRISEADKQGEVYEKIASYVLAENSENKKWLADELKNLEENKKWLADELKNLEEMQKAGRFDAEKADTYRRELYDRAMNKEIESALSKAREDNRSKELEKQKNINEHKDTVRELLELENIQKDIKDYRDVNDELLEVEEENAGEDDQTKELDLARAKELELAQAQELEKQKNIEEHLDINKELLELEEEIARERAPLVAISADLTHDKQEMAHDLAEQALNAELAEGNIVNKFIKGIWKGTLFKKYYEKKYEKEFLSGERTNEEGKTITELIKEQSSGIMERFVLGAVEDYRYIHKESGEFIKEFDEETNGKIKHAIEEYARTSLEKGEKVSDLNREFMNEMSRIMKDAAQEGRIERGYKQTNYLEVAKEAARRYEEIAINAKGKAEHDKAMAEVMAGFQAYYGEVRNNARTEVHRDNIDKIVNALESSKIGQFIPAEVVAGATGAAIALTQTGVRVVFGIAGGFIASGAISSLRERNRITEDRARMLRDVASGKDYYSKDKKISKYEQRIGGTLYDMEEASDLTNRINSAMDPENGEINKKELLSAIAEARTRILVSDESRKDLISYSSDQDRGQERLDLDIAVIRATKALSKKEQGILEEMENAIRKELDQQISDKDKDFKKVRAKTALKRTGVSLAIGAALFFISQEASAAVDPTKIGIFEKFGLIKTQNAVDAKETILASGFGQFRGSYEAIGNSTTTRVDGISSPEDIKRFEADGYTKIKTGDAWHELKVKLAEVNPSESTAKVDVKYDGWASNGGLKTGIENGKFISSIRGAATVNGRSVNYTPDQLKAFITIGNSKFEIAGAVDGSGQLSWGENGVFTTTTGETIKAIGDNGEKLYKYFEIAAVNNVDGNGVQHIVPLATDIGKNTFSGKIEQVVKTVVEHPAAYSFVKEIPGHSETFVRGITTNGFAFAPELGRTGLGEVVAPESLSEEIYEPSGESTPQPSLREALDSVPEENIETMPSAPVEVDTTSEAAPEEVTLESPVNLSVSEATQPETDSYYPASEEAANTTIEPSYNAEEITPTQEEQERARYEREDEPQYRGMDLENWQNAIMSEIENARPIIGDEGVAALTETEPLNDEMQKRWREWWSNLSEEAKDRVKDIHNLVRFSEHAYDPNRTIDGPFGTWLTLNS